LVGRVGTQERESTHSSLLSPSVPLVLLEPQGIQYETIPCRGG